MATIIAGRARGQSPYLSPPRSLARSPRLSMCVTKKSHNAKPHFATESIIIVIIDTPGEKIGTALEMKNDIVAFGEYTNVPPSREFVRPSIRRLIVVVLCPTFMKYSRTMPVPVRAIAATAFRQLFMVMSPRRTVLRLTASSCPKWGKGKWGKRKGNIECNKVSLQRTMCLQK